jgi:WD40 repeat protein
LVSITNFAPLSGFAVNSTAPLSSAVVSGLPVLSQTVTRSSSFLSSVVSLSDWSPDGRHLLFSATTSSDYDLWLVPLAGDSKPVGFLTAPGDQWHGNFSPDGKLLAYSDLAMTLHLVDTASGVLRTVDQGSFAEITEYTFSPDGHAVAVDAAWAGPRRIWQLDLRGRNRADSAHVPAGEVDTNHAANGSDRQEDEPYRGQCFAGAAEPRTPRCRPDRRRLPIPPSPAAKSWNRAFHFS